MYYFSENKDVILEKINKDIFNFKYPDVYFATQLHGTFSSKNVKYISDVDMEMHILFQNDKKQIISFIISLIDHLTKEGYIFENFLSGIDKRLEFEFKIMKDGSIRNYNPEQVKEKVLKAQQSGILTEEEVVEIEKYIVKNPTWEEAQKIINLTEDKQKIPWTIDELKKGKKEYYGVEYSLMDTIITNNFPNVLTTIMPYNDNKYLEVDISFMIVGFRSIEEGKKYLTEMTDYIQYYAGKIILNDRLREITTLHFYHGFFKNVVEKKYFKALKRLRTILGTCVHRHNEQLNRSDSICRDKRYRTLICKERNKIRELSNTELGAYNQLKNRIGITLFLLKNKKLSELKIKEQIILILKDILDETSFKSNTISKINNQLGKKFDTKKQLELLKDLQNEITNEMNNKAYPLLVEHYNDVKHLLPFKWNRNNNKK